MLLVGLSDAARLAHKHKATIDRTMKTARHPTLLPRAVSAGSISPNWTACFRLAGHQPGACFVRMCSRARAWERGVR